MSKPVSANVETIWLAVDQDGSVIDTWWKGSLAMTFKQWRNDMRGMPDVSVQNYMITRIS